MDKPFYSRNFTVNYFEKDENLWSLTSYLKDNTHEIKVQLDILVPDMIIKNANVDFLKYPMEDCSVIKAKIEEVIGLCLYDDFSDKIRQLFLGGSGCSNVMHLLGISAPAMIYFYYTEQIKRGNMNHRQWWNFVITKLPDACIAHKMLLEKYKK
ncbi:DUF2889 domain-containing protein [Clostridium sp. WILCCON 0269]|uniref:DUF2889 domain-containing protein n=1 Tax=Candidatus Clostridium eludens TaxID=3381663 RepID=A0ABW8SQD9_9CLOT